MKKILLILTSFLLLCILSSCGGGSGSSTSTPDSEETGNIDNVDSSGDGSGNQNSDSGENTGSTDSSDTGSGSDNSDSGDGGGDTGNSSDGSGNSGSTVTIPGAPADLVIDSVTASTITLSWKAVSGASSYKLYRSTSESGSYSAVVNNTTDTSLTDSGLAPLTTYYYKITAVNSAGESEASIAVVGATLTTVSVNIEFDPALVSIIGDMKVSVAGSNITSTLAGSAATTSYTATVEAPEGSAISFSVLADTADDDTSAALQYYGEAIAEVTSDTESVTVDMKLHKTRIVLPDAMASRIVQVDDMTGSNWKEIDLSDYYDTAGLSGQFCPWQIDFDNAGRIYTTNMHYTNSYTASGVLRIDSMYDGSTVTRIAGDDENGTALARVNRMAIDRDQGIMYYYTSADMATTDYHIYRSSLEGDSVESIDISSFMDSSDSNSGILGITAGKNGTIYLSGCFTNQDPDQQILHLDVSTPSSPQLLHSIALTGSSTPVYAYDLVLYKDSLYATVCIDRGTDSPNYIASIDLDLASDSLVTNTFLQPGETEYFSFPATFVGVRPEDLIFIVDGGDGERQLVSIGDITDTAFTLYDDGINTFSFYSGC